MSHKYRRAWINIDDLGKIIKEQGDKISNSERGRKLWVDITEFSDGNLSLAFYDGTERKVFGRSIQPKEQKGGADLW